MDRLDPYPPGEAAMTGSMNGPMNGRLDHDRLWERYMGIERRELEDRKNSELERALGAALAGESQEEIDRMAREDREKAEQGLVELREGAESHYKHIEELTLRDRAGRLQAQKSRMTWVRERLEKKASMETSGNASTSTSTSLASSPGSLTGEAVAGEEPAGATGEAWQ